MKYTITGEKKELKYGLVDYIAEAYIEEDGDRIPCEVGYIDDEPMFIFITEDGITKSGHHYYKETIKL